MNQLSMFSDFKPTPVHPIAEMQRASNGSANYRWWLTRDWGAAGPQVCWIMLNPSSANSVQEDPTLHRIIGFSRRWGFGRLVVVNLYPFRSPNPAECKRWADWESNGPDYYARDAMYHNEDQVVRFAKASRLVVAAWGAAPWAADYANHIVEAISEGVEPYPMLHCLGTTAAGSPTHPLARGKHRVPDDQQPILWRDCA